MPAPKKTTSRTRKSTTARKTTPRKRTPAKPKDPFVEAAQSAAEAAAVETPREARIVSHEEKAAKTEAYHTLKSAGVEVPTDLAIEVEAWIAEAQALHAQQQEQITAQEEERQRQVTEANINGPWYVRNGTRTQFNIRLDRQTEKRRIQLKPRGEPGDMHPLKDEDLNDTVLLQNVNLGLCEVIPAGEANEVSRNQTRNMGNRVHTPLAVLTNERGEAYKNNAFRVEAEFNSQGVTVAQLDPRAMQGQMHDRELKQTGGLTRQNPGQPQAPEYASAFVPTGGNPAVIGQGPQNQIQVDIANRAKAQREAQLHAGPGELKVSVDPVHRT
jgi:hypothetical protein